MSYRSLRPLLFSLDPEVSHHFALKALAYLHCLPPLKKVVQTSFRFQDPRLKQEIFDLPFQNPVGLAAGFDKDACAIDGFSALGFGHIEVGTVTVKPQNGNPKPRLFRLKNYESIQNAMGFNNQGKDALLSRLKKNYPLSLPIGINIGKNKITPPEKSLDDYLELLNSLGEVCDYFVINVSSPNTPGLRDLANENFIEKLFSMAKEITTKPILLKLSPDHETGEIVGLAEAAVNSGASGIIATNTTTDYSLCPDSKSFGGLSGKVLRDRSLEVLKAIAKRLFGKTTLISVGGIDSGAEAYRRIQEGASLVQIYSAMIFQGPGLVGKVNKELVDLLDADNFSHISEAIGCNR